MFILFDFHAPEDFLNVYIKLTTMDMNGLNLCYIFIFFVLWVGSSPGMGAYKQYIQTTISCILMQIFQFHGMENPNKCDIMTRSFVKFSTLFKVQTFVRIIFGYSVNMKYSLYH